MIMRATRLWFVSYVLLLLPLGEAAHDFRPPSSEPECQTMPVTYGAVLGCLSGLRPYSR
jgi:hypothetical protein